MLRATRSAGSALRRRLRRCDEAVFAAGEKNLAEAVSPAETLNAGAADVEARERAESWRAENRGALDSSNSYVDKYGLPLSRHRKF